MHDIYNANNYSQCSNENENNMFKMASIGERTTGLPMVILVSEKNNSTDPTIKVSRTYNHRVISEDTFSIDISDKPEIVYGDKEEISEKDLEKVKDWVVINKVALIKYWNFEILTDELLTILKKI
jgi:hypothetical protein